MSDDIDRTFQQKSQLDHVRIRPDMYIGSVEVDKIPMYILNEETEKFTLEEMEFSSGLLKIVDEIIVNSIDHHTIYPKLVKNIKIGFDIETGYVTVENDGPGISVIKVDTLDHGSMYKPQAIFSEFLSGDNFADKDDKITGGCNGLGSKAVVAFSDIFSVETYDEKKKLLYTQTFKKRLDIIEEPVLTECEGIGHTKITFLPSYKNFGYKKYTKKFGKIIYKLIETRSYQTAAFVNDCTIWFNDDKLYFEETGESNFTQFCQMFITNDYGLYSTTLINPTNTKLNMEVCIGISDGKSRNASIINGISVYDGGNHIKHLEKEIVENIMPKITALLPKSEKKIHPTVILNNLFIFVKCSMANPKFGSQSKSNLTTPIDKMAVFKFKDKGKNNEWEKIWTLIKAHVMSSILGKLSDKPKSRVTRGKVIVKKGSDAKFAGMKKTAMKCSLIINEGDSAMSLSESGINHKHSELDHDYYGLFSIQGVPINARKETSVFKDEKTNKEFRIRTEKLQNNIRFTELVKLIGLDYEKTYKNDSSEGNKEFETLRYGRIIISTDADTDGRGMICALLVNFFTLFWPELIKRGYIKTFITPMIRAYPKKVGSVVKEFNSLYAFNEWISKKYAGQNEAVLKEYNINYYKGLGSIMEHEVLPTFKNFESKLNTYTYDKVAQESLDIYFGNDTDPRKNALRTPVAVGDIVLYNKSQSLPITTFLNVDTKEFQRDNIIRKLPHICDGLVPSRRKALFAARLDKTIEHTKKKVSSFAGYVTDKASYMHGEASLNSTITKMAQSFVGARNLPLLIGLGQFGSRKGAPAASPRYIYIKINKAISDTIYPYADDFLLRYAFEDGERCEPEYYCPIIPTCVLENMQLPATGWKILLWARDIDSVIKNVRRMITQEITKCKKMPIWLRNNKSDIRVASDGKEYMVGKYKYDEKNNTVIVTELPIGIFNKKYITSVANNSDGTYIKEIKNVEDYSNKDEKTNIDQVDIHFELQPGAMNEIKAKYEIALNNKKIIEREVKEKKKAKKEKVVVADPDDIDNLDDIESQSGKSTNEILDDLDVEDYVANPLFDPVETFFKLRHCITSNINVIGINGEVREFNYYSSIVNAWFIERKRLYKERIERQLILKKLYILQLENIIRFSKERDSIKITNKTAVDKFTKILTENKYVKFNKSLLNNPKYLPVSTLESEILNTDASYNYIIDLTYRSLLKEACDKRDIELKKEQKELANLLDDCIENEGHFIGQKTWLKELEKAEKIINAGISEGWAKEKNAPIFE